MNKNILAIAIFDNNKVHNIVSKSPITDGYIKGFVLDLNVDIFDMGGEIHSFQDEVAEIYMTKLSSQYYMACWIVHNYSKRLLKTMFDEIGKEFDINKLVVDKQIFTSIITKIMNKYDKPEEFDKITLDQNKINDVKIKMHSNIDELLENTTKLEHIEKASNELKHLTIIFNNDARKLKNKMWWDNMKYYFIIGGAIGIVIAILIIIIYFSTQ
jgi:hypothetical protein